MATESLPFDQSLLKRRVINFSTAGGAEDNTIIPAVTGKRFIIIQYLIKVSATVKLTLEDGVSGSELTGDMHINNSTTQHGVYSPIGHFETTVGKLLNIASSAATSNVSGYINYLEV